MEAASGSSWAAPAQSVEHGVAQVENNRNGNKFGFQGFGTSKNVLHLGLICVRCLELQLCLESLVHNRGYLGFPILLLQGIKRTTYLSC